jgi:hypothetical protein
MTRKFFTVAALFGMGMFLYGSTAWAAGEGECSGGACGTPDTSGGGCGCGGGGSILVNNTDTGDTYQYADDYDEDGREDDVDTCPFVANKDQVDSDGDGLGDVCDNAPLVANKDQKDSDADGIGDVADMDADNDGLDNKADLCPLVANPSQIDTDGDKIGDACDDDADNDGVKNAADNCPLVANPDQKNTDPNTFGDACDNDTDKDDIEDAKDNCPLVANRDQKKTFAAASLGDACNPDIDGDKVPNLTDNCPLLANKDQADTDRDGKGDLCDSRYCFVVNGDEKNCLDPKVTFHVFSPSGRVQTGDEIRLRLFANRENAAIQYTWIVKQRPSGSNATVTNPKGTVRMSTPYEYHYLKGNVASFVADEPGEYQIQLSGDLVFPDTVNPNFPRTDTYVMTITAEGDSTGGCAMGGARANLTLGLVLAGLMGMVVLCRRNRRK